MQQSRQPRHIRSAALHYAVCLFLTARFNDIHFSINYLFRRHFNIEAICVIRFSFFREKKTLSQCDKKRTPRTSNRDYA